MRCPVEADLARYHREQAELGALYEQVEEEVKDLNLSDLFKEIDDYGINIPETMSIERARAELVEKKVCLLRYPHD